MAATSASIVLPTTFTPPPECTASATGFTLKHGVLEVNPIYTDFEPASLVTKCYPSQLASAAAYISEERKLLKELVCPLGWGTNDLNSTYRICCPPNLKLDNLPLRSGLFDRPGEHAICTTSISYGREVTVTSFDSQSSRVYTTTVGSYAVAYGEVFDGYIPAGETASTASTATSSPSMTVPPASSRASGAAASSTTGAGHSNMALCKLALVLGVLSSVVLANAL